MGRLAATVSSFVLLFLALVSLAPAPARAQQDRVIYDQWTEFYQAGRKITWEHAVVTERTGGAPGTPRILVDKETWVPTERGTSTSVEHLECDETGLIISREGRQDGMFGTTTWSCRRGEGGVVSRRAQIHGQAEVTGETHEAVRDADAVATLMLLGAVPVGEQSIESLGMPGGVVETETLRGTTEADGTLRVERVSDNETTTVWLSRSAGFVRGECVAAAIELVTATADEARDPARTRPIPAAPGFSASGYTDERLGIALRTPVPGWMFKIQDTEGKHMAGLFHIDGAALLVMGMPIVPPADATARQRLGDLIAQQSAANQDPNSDRRMVMSHPAPQDFMERPAVHFDIDGTQGTIAMAGDAWIVGGSNGGLLIMVILPRDVIEEAAVLKDQALSYLSLGGELTSEIAVRTITSTAGPSIDIPANWVEGQGGMFQAPDGLTGVKVVAIPVQAGATPRAVEDQVLAVDARNFQSVERRADTSETVGGRSCRRVVVAATAVRGANQFRMTFVYVFSEERGRLVLVVGWTSELASDTGAVDRIIGGVRWGAP